MEFTQTKCAKVLDKATTIIVTCCHDDVLAEIDALPNLIILKVSNVGKDIGGKLLGLSYYLNYCQQTDFIVSLHDKISPQTINAEYWQDQLYSIFEPIKLNAIFELFNRESKVGLVGNKTFLRNEYDRTTKTFLTTNNSLLHNLIDRYCLNVSKFDFIAGTVFVVRAKIFETFFTLHSPITIRASLEAANVLDLTHGTNTHCWERLLCFIPNHYHYEVRGI